MLERNSTTYTLYVHYTTQCELYKVSVESTLHRQSKSLGVAVLRYMVGKGNWQTFSCSLIPQRGKDGILKTFILYASLQHIFYIFLVESENSQLITEACLFISLLKFSSSSFNGRINTLPLQYTIHERVQKDKSETTMYCMCTVETIIYMYTSLIIYIC